LAAAIFASKSSGEALQGELSLWFLARGGSAKSPS
jgi:hypothetical protein